MGLAGVEPATSALSELTGELVRQLVHPLTCPFVPRLAAQRRFVPLRLGTLWARLEVDMTITVQCPLSVQDDIGSAHTRPTAAWLSLRARPRRRSSPPSVSPAAIEPPRAGETDGGVDRLYVPVSPPTSLQPSSISPIGLFPFV